METLLSNVATSESILTNENDECVVNFEKLPTDSRYLSNNFVALSPVEPVSHDQQVYTFRIADNDSLNFTLLSEIYCSAKISLVKQTTGSEEWVPVEEADNVLPTLHFTDLMWSKVELFLNHTRISSTNTFRFLSASIARRLYFQSRANRTFLQTEIAPGDLNADPDNTFTNDSEDLKKRRNLFVKNSDGTAPVKLLVGLLTHDLSTLNHPIPNKCEIIIQLTRNTVERLLDIGPAKEADKDTFSLPSTTRYRIRIHELNLLVRRPLLSEQALSVVQKNLASKPIRYYFLKMEMSWQSLEYGKQIYNSPELFSNYK